MHAHSLARRAGASGRTVYCSVCVHVFAWPPCRHTCSRPTQPYLLAGAGEILLIIICVCSSVLALLVVLWAQAFFFIYGFLPVAFTQLYNSSCLNHTRSII